MTDYLTVVEVLAIHDDQIERYGGSAGLRDPGLLEAAVYRPQSGHYGDLVAEAAELWESLAQNHPFIDANKRTAFVACFTFLRLNRVDLRPEPVEGVRMMEDVASSVLTEKSFASWLRAMGEKQR